MFSSNANQASNPLYIENVFSTYLYTGTGASLTITNNIDTTTYGGLTWIKSRSAVTDHKLTDTARGVTKALISDTTAAQTTDTTGLTAFGTTGFTIGANTDYNTSAATYASWTFRKQTKFFDVVTYTGTGVQRTVNHNLGSVPGCIIVKCTSTALPNGDASNWTVYHRGVDATSPESYFLLLNTTASYNAGANRWGNTAPTSTNFTVGTSAQVNWSGETYVAYIFAHNAGGFGLTGADNVISCGTFTTDGSANATVNLGYEPQWILSKRVNIAANWQIVDNMRGFTANTQPDPILEPNTSRAEQNDDWATITSTGFTGPFSSASQTYIYIAIRRGPMAVPTLGTSVFKPTVRSGTGAVASTTGVGFPPSLLISAGAGWSRGWFDRLRGPLITIESNITAAEVSSTGSVTSYNMDGVSFGADGDHATVNYSGSYSQYYFQRAPSFFDEVCWTGNSTYGRSLSHNLAAVPELLITKGRSVGSNWFVYSNFTPTSFKYGNLNTTSLFSSRLYTDVAEGLSSQPTSTALNLDDSGRTNNSGDTYVAYLFATCAGVSKVGTYTGNGTTQTIDCGFGAGGARFVLIKRTDATGGWYVYDTARGMTVLTDPYLLLNSTAAEVATLGSVTTVSTGFAVDNSILAGINAASPAAYIFLAIA